MLKKIGWCPDGISTIQMHDGINGLIIDSNWVCSWTKRHLEWRFSTQIAFLCRNRHNLSLWTTRFFNIFICIYMFAYNAYAECLYSNRWSKIGLHFIFFWNNWLLISLESNDENILKAAILVWKVHTIHFFHCDHALAVLPCQSGDYDLSV